ncbi:MAG TPA: phage virion morphogenesis protein [Syntrophorhabdaceae bacterium]|jgi:phage virion morphogenesis protein|nr:phage virion morphogenesis protein [Syntrophorhabdaceae bacterium]
MDITIKVDDTGVQNLLKTLQSRIKHMQPIMRSISEIMRDEVEENFAQQGRPKWEPLKASTIANRTKQGYWPGKILQMHGHLAASISAKATDTQAVVGTNVKYAAIHQFGGKTPPTVIRPKNKKALFWPGAAHPVKSVKRPGVTIPARPFLIIPETGMGKIRQRLIQYITDGGK